MLKTGRPDRASRELTGLPGRQDSSSMNPRSRGDDDIAAQHLDEDLIERFVACEATRRENRNVVRHLLGDCTACKAKIWRRWRPEPDAEYESALLRLMYAWAARANKAWGQVLPFRGRSPARKEEGA